MEAITIRAIANEVSSLCVPSRVGAVGQSSPLDIFLALRGGGERFLVLSARPEAPSMHLAGERPATLPSPTAFCRLLRKHLAGLVLVAVERRGLERAVDLLFGPSAAAPPHMRLVVEIMGRWSNIILVEEGTNLVVDSLRHVPGEVSSLRAVLPGETYRPPPRGERVDPTEVEEDEFRDRCGAAIAGARPLTEVFVGLGRGLLALSGAGDGPPDGETCCAAVYDGIREVTRRVDAGATEPRLYPRRRIVLPLPAAPWAAEEAVPFASVAAAAAHLFAETTGGEKRRALVAAARREASRLRKRLRKNLRRLEEEAQEAGEEGRLQAAAGALLAALDRVPRGATGFTWVDPADPAGVEKTVELNPALSPRRNAEALFRRARKVRRRAERARGRLPGARAELERVEAHLAGLADLPLEELRRLAAPRPGRGAAAKNISAARRAPVREYRRGDWRILVGKSSRGNDELTTRIAKPGDCWLHTRDYAGAHVVIKGSGEPPEDVIRAAGEAAAWHSAARSERLVDVAYTERRYVRKIKGQAAGQVTLSQSKTVRVRPRVPEGFVEAAADVIR